MFFLPSLILAITFITQEEKDTEIDRLNKEFEKAKCGVNNYNAALKKIMSEQAIIAEIVQKTEREKDELTELMDQLRKRGKWQEYFLKVEEYTSSVQKLIDNEIEKERIDKRVEATKQEVADVEKELEMTKRQRDEAMNASVLK